MAKMVFPSFFNDKVDLKKVKLEVINQWVAERVTELLGFEDDIVVSMIINMLEPKVDEPLDPRKLQMNVTGFLEKDAAPFTEELWLLLLSAQKHPTGIPLAILEKKKEEMSKVAEEKEQLKRVLDQKQNEEKQNTKESNTKRANDTREHVFDGGESRANRHRDGDPKRKCSVSDRRSRSYQRSSTRSQRRSQLRSRRYSPSRSKSPKRRPQSFSSRSPREVHQDRFKRSFHRNFSRSCSRSKYRDRRSRRSARQRSSSSVSMSSSGSSKPRSSRSRSSISSDSE